MLISNLFSQVAGKKDQDLRFIIKKYEPENNNEEKSIDSKHLFWHVTLCAAAINFISILLMIDIILESNSLLKNLMWVNSWWTKKNTVKLVLCLKTILRPHLIGCFKESKAFSQREKAPPLYTNLHQDGRMRLSLSSLISRIIQSLLLIIRIVSPSWPFMTWMSS